jgi:hypothetical protein
MNRLFGSFFDTDTVRARGNLQRRWIPPMDLVEDGERYVLRSTSPEWLRTTSTLSSARMC